MTKDLSPPATQQQGERGLCSVYTSSCLRFEPITARLTCREKTEVFKSLI